MSKLILKIVSTMGLIILASLAGAQDIAEELYSRYESSVYRVEVVTPGIENKASVGTGFVIGRNDILASNYHVISNVVNEPDRYRLEWEGVDGRRGPLTVLAVDVVHDLAILQAEEPMGLPMQITDLPENGVSLFSMGHPLALDLAIVSGTNNGIQASSLYEKILFSGNINPGMSGGPTLDRLGQVVGINVATSGEALGYLVPATYLDKLLADVRATDFRPETDLATSISNQLTDNQQSLVDEILSNEWRNISLGNLSVPGRVFDRLDCWSLKKALTAIPSMPRFVRGRIQFIFPSSYVLVRFPMNSTGWIPNSYRHPRFTRFISAAVVAAFLHDQVKKMSAISAVPRNLSNCPGRISKPISVPARIWIIRS